MVLKNGEVIENLGDGYHIIQNKENFCYGTDAAVLADFAVAKPKERAIDLCTGTAIVPILMCKKTRCPEFFALEIQEEMCEIATRSVALNHLENRLKIVCGDLKNVKSLFACGSFDVVTCNPPYMIPGTGKTNLSESVKIARHEILCNLEDVICAAAYLLKSGGRFYIVHRAERLVDVLTLMRKYRTEPKRLTFVSATPESEPSLILVEGQKDRKKGLIVTKPIYVNV